MKPGELEAVINDVDAKEIEARLSAFMPFSSPYRYGANTEGFINAKSNQDGNRCLPFGDYQSWLIGLKGMLIELDALIGFIMAKTARQEYVEPNLPVEEEDAESD